MAESAASRGTGIARRNEDYVIQKIIAGLAIIATNTENGEWAGFCCIEAWEHEKYIANSGLIVHPAYRGQGLSREIKIKLFDLGRIKFPSAKIFSLTTNAAVIRINGELGYHSIPYSEVMNDAYFLIGNSCWVNYIDLMCNPQTASRYTAMVFDPGTKAVKMGPNRRRKNRGLARVG